MSQTPHVPNILNLVFVFTSLLFLSGYVLQQKTVHNLQTIIQPRLPTPRPLPTPSPLPFDPRTKAARPLGRPDGPSKHLQTYLYSAKASIDWSKLAYVQLVKDHVDVCSAVMLFSELHRLRSAPRRVLLFPKTWAVTEQAEARDPYLDTTRRLMRKAARQYRVLLVPMDPLLKGADADSPASYSLASIFSLTEYDRVLYLEPPGVLLDSSSLDALLAFAPEQSVAALPANETKSVLSTHLLLARPSAMHLNRLLRTYSSRPQSDLDLFQHVFPAPESLLSDWFMSPDALMADTASLALATTTFNASSYLSFTAYIRLWDPGLPGPEYNVPYTDKERVRPKPRAAKDVWDRMYEIFRQERMEVCGLDLETWREPDQAAELASSQIANDVRVLSISW